MRLKFRNALAALSSVLFFIVFASCQKDHDLVSSYVIKSAQPKMQRMAKVAKVIEENPPIQTANEVEKIVRISK